MNVIKISKHRFIICNIHRHVIVRTLPVAVGLLVTRATLLGTNRLWLLFNGSGDLILIPAVVKNWGSYENNKRNKACYFPVA